MSKLLQVNDLTTEFTGDFWKKISVDHVSFDVAEGETVCIVGESGCGKSVTSLSIMGLLGRGGAVVDGSVLFANKNLLDMDEKQLDTIRGNQMTMIFQDPLTSLNPVFTIGSQITESIRIHMHLSKKEAGERAVTILEKVGMPDARAAMKKYPHMLSGGMRQRTVVFCLANYLYSSGFNIILFVLLKLLKFKYISLICLCNCLLAFKLL